MARAQKAELQVESMKMNRVRPGTNAGFNLLFTLLAAMAIIPVLFVFMISISSEESIRVSGYSFVPQSFSNSAYMFLWNERATILSALWISVLVTVSGTVLGLALTTTMGYVLSRPGFKLKGFYTWVVFIPMIFNGGMVASYVVNANILNMNRTASSSPQRLTAPASCAFSAPLSCPSQSPCWPPSACSLPLAIGTTGSSPPCTSPGRSWCPSRHCSTT